MPWRFSASRRGATRRGPALGEHTEPVLRDLVGYEDERIAALRASGALGGSPAEFPRPRPVSLETLVRQRRIRELDPDYRERIRPE